MRKLNRVTAAAFAAAAALALWAPAASAQAVTAHPTPAVNRCLHDWTFQSMGPNDNTPRGYLNVSGAGGSGTDVITWYSSPGASNEYWCMEPGEPGRLQTVRPGTSWPVSVWRQ
ncbi:hypothetical protein ABH935_008574 [Catenulispora sp. GAS73]|uniref:hypothetical protein n=1 Tax=Catenulispora sp. GAS73 TaxID=3156269 RepID=UPI003516571E